MMVPAACWPLLGASACRFAGWLVEQFPDFIREAAARILFRLPIVERPICTRSASARQGTFCKLKPACTNFINGVGGSSAWATTLTKYELSATGLTMVFLSYPFPMTFRNACQPVKDTHSVHVPEAVPRSTAPRSGANLMLLGSSMRSINEPSYQKHHHVCVWIVNRSGESLTF